MAEVSVAALLVCALALQVRAQGNPEACSNGQCQTRCYTAFSSTLVAPQTNAGTCANNVNNRPACCSGTAPSWQWSQWSGCSGSSCTQTRFQVCRAGNGEEAVVQDCPVFQGAFIEQQPCASTACFRVTAWSAWTPCSSRCSTGTRTRSRRCVDSQGSSLPAASCNLSFNDLWQTETCDGRCDAYRWSEWRATTACNSNCRESVARDCLFNGVPVDTSLCSGLSQDTRPCATPSQNCPGYRWSDWVTQGSCDFNTCTQTVTRTCVDSNGFPMATSLCGGATSSVQRCSCPTASQYGWSTDRWGAWSGCVSGATAQVRRRPCVVLATDVVVPDFLCTGSSPSESQLCGATSQYAWSTTQWGQWSGCTSTSATDTRRRVCQDTSSGVTLPDAFCAGTAQSEIRSCRYVPGQWSSWSTCSFGQRTRTRSCQDQTTFATVGDFSCSGYSLQETQYCDTQYAWSTTLWSQWSGCAGFSSLTTETRRRVCVDGSGDQASDFQCSGSPATETRTCTQYVWSTTRWTEWEGCSSGQSVDTRRRVCEDRSGNQALVFQCSGSPATETRPCSQYVPAQWSAWTGCGSGSLTEQRTRQCQLQSTQLVVDSSLCGGYNLLETRACSIYSWGEWSDYGICSAPCGQSGLQVRERFCQDASGQVVADDLCSGDQPGDSRACTGSCTTWNTWGAWSSGCSSPDCSQTRTRTCPALASGSCTGPASELRACSAGQCGSSNYGDWSEWSSCDRSCRQFRSRTCLSLTACTGVSQESRVCETCPSMEVCGKFYYTEPRILNSNVSSTCTWPWMANVRTSDGVGGFTSLCSAVLIDQNSLVTSATCVDRINSNANVQVVLNDGQGRTTDFQEQVFSIASAFPHVSYSRNLANEVFSTGNIGIIQLSSSVGYSNECIQPVCLPDSDTQFSNSGNYIAAWGQTSNFGATTDQLRDARVSVTSGLTCSVAVTFSGRSSEALPEDLICSNYQRNDQAVTCPRDEGGMLVAQDTSGAWVLRGINVDNACDAGQPSLFVDVTQYDDYLRAEMARN